MVGSKISDFISLDFENFGIDGSFLVGEVIFADNFGNVITNIPEEVVLKFSNFGSQIEINSRRVPFVQTYGFVGPKKPLALIGSHDNYEGAPSDGSAWEDGSSSIRVIRGGCWFRNARFCRSADRDGNNSDNHISFVGFRLLRKL